MNTATGTANARAVREAPLLTRATVEMVGQYPPPLLTIATATETETAETGWMSIETMDETETETGTGTVSVASVTATATATGIGIASGMEILEADGTRVERPARFLRRGDHASSMKTTWRGSGNHREEEDHLVSNLLRFGTVPLPLPMRPHLDLVHPRSELRTSDH